MTLVEPIRRRFVLPPRRRPARAALPAPAILPLSSIMKVSAIIPPTSLVIHLPFHRYSVTLDYDEAGFVRAIRWKQLRSPRFWPIE